VIEPRNVTRVLSLRHLPERGPSLALATPGPTGVPGHTGVGGTWRMIIGFLGNLGDPDSSVKKTGSGATGTANSRMIRRLCVCGRTGTNRRRSKVSPSEGNEVRREDCQEVAVPHSSVEAGERPSGPRGAKGVPRCGRGVGTTPRTPCLTSVSPRNDLVM
jgi:hypothetical protein